MDIQTLAEARNETGVSWASIARKMEIADETLRMWRRGLVKVQKHRWKQLARAIGVEPDDFDRDQYNREFGAIQRQKAPQTPLEPKKAPTPPTPPIPAPHDEEVGILDAWFRPNQGATA